jgi:ligand-binding SRPBCC domain-containing protein
MTITKEWKTIIKSDLDTVWDFFSTPDNLNNITPDEMKFEFLTDTAGKKMYEGMIIKYKVSPFPGVKMNWVTEITKISDKNYFVDEQRIGPYKMWHHEHHFKALDNNTTEMIDILNYNVGKGILGPIADKLIVNKKVDLIFDFRQSTIDKYFS